MKNEFQVLPRDRHEIVPAIEDIEEAREYIQELYERGVRPQVSVPERFSHALGQGLRAHATWIPELSLIVGTFGREPYMPLGEQRFLCQVDVKIEQVEPRFTGPDKCFHGVVAINGPVLPHNIRLLEK